jgi:hypothetical protein
VPGFLFLARSKFILKSAQKQKTRKLRSNFGFMLAMNKSTGTGASVIRKSIKTNDESGMMR